MVLQKLAHKRILTVLAAVFFMIYWIPSWPFNLATQPDGSPAHLILNQPDEVAFYHVVRRVATGETPGTPEILAEVSESQVHPRSTTVVGGRIVPIGFPAAMLLYGFFARIDTAIMGDWFLNLSMTAATPFVAAIAPLLLYYLVRYISRRRDVALYAAVTMFVLPPWWYYASRPFQHHTLFVFLVLLALVQFVRAHHLPHTRRRFVEMLVSFTAVGGAILVRPTETLWLVALGALLLFWHRSKLYNHDYIALGTAVVIIIARYLLTQLMVYAHVFGSGYVKPAADGTAGLLSSGPQGVPLWQSVIAPFGFSFVTTARTSLAYLGQLFPLWALAVILSVALALWLHTDNRRLRAYTIGYLLVAVLLLIYYGSWQFTDNLAGNISIGSSQVRYFLPLYVGAVPFVALALSWLSRHRQRGKMTAAFIFGALFFASYSAVYPSFEGLTHIRTVKALYEDYQSRIYAQVPEDAVIITRYADKYLYPGRKVLTGLDHADFRAGASALAENQTPLYLFDLKGYAEGDVVQLWLDETFGSLVLLDEFDGLELYRVEIAR